MKEYVCTLCSTEEIMSYEKKGTVAHIKIRDDDEPENHGWSLYKKKWICNRHEESAWNERNKQH